MSDKEARSAASICPACEQPWSEHAQGIDGYSRKCLPRTPSAAYTPAQALAVEHVCLLAEECAHPRFGRVTPLGTVVLTINAGYE